MSEKTITEPYLKVQLANYAETFLDQFDKYFEKTCYKMIIDCLSTKKETDIFFRIVPKGNNSKKINFKHAWLYNFRKNRFQLKKKAMQTESKYGTCFYGFLPTCFYVFKPNQIELWDLETANKDIWIFMDAILRTNSVRIGDNMITFSFDAQTPKAPSKEELIKYAEIISDETNEFLDGQDLYSNATVYDVQDMVPLMMIKISYEGEKKDIQISESFNQTELDLLTEWEKKHQAPYCYMAVNILEGDNAYLIRPNLHNFWSQEMAMFDFGVLTVQILMGEKK